MQAPASTAEADGNPPSLASTPPALGARTGGSIDLAHFASLPSHARAAAVNQRWAAWQAAQAVTAAQRRQASDKVAALLNSNHAVLPRLDVAALEQACAAGCDVTAAIRLSRWMKDGDAPLNVDEITACAKAGLLGVRGMKVVRLYRSLTLPLRADTAPCLWKVEDLEDKVFLKQGSYNETSLVMFEGKQHVFKLDPGKVSPSHVKKSAFPKRMLCSVHNLAASLIDQALGWKTMCEVRLAIDDYDGTPRLGILMSYAQGKNVISGLWKTITASGRTTFFDSLAEFGPPGSPDHKYAWIQAIVRDKTVGIAEDGDTLMLLPDRSTGVLSPAVAARTDVIVGMLRKQAIGWIIGDLDGSSGNYVYDELTSTLTGFDKDFAFSTRPAFEENYCWEGHLPSFWRNMGVPPWLDHAGYAGVRALRDRLPSMLDGLLDPAAIRTCVARTNVLLCFTRSASPEELAAIDWTRPPTENSLNGSTLLWRDVYRLV